MSKKADLQLRQKMLRGFRVWAMVDHEQSIKQHTFSVLNSLLGSAKNGCCIRAYCTGVARCSGSVSGRRRCSW